MKRNYHTIDSTGKVNERKLAEFLSRQGQFLLPMVDLIEQSRMAVEELIDVAGRLTIEAVLNLSAQQLAGAPCQGKAREGEIGWHGKQQGSVYLKERKLQVDKPRLRRKGRGPGKEVAIPAYEAMQDREGMGARMLDLLMRGVTTRQYQQVIPAMAETVGVAKSSVSRETIVAAEKQLEELTARRFDNLNLLIIYIDGMALGDHCVIGAVGVDAEGRKHLLGIQGGGHRERRRGEGSFGKVGGARGGSCAQAIVRDRWIEGVADGDQRRFRRRHPGATLPAAQAAERARAPSRRAERPSEISDARRLAVGA